MPQVRSFGVAPTPSPLTKHLETVNLFAPTTMCRVMTKYGSDKGRLNNYTPLYSALSRTALRVFELGLGSKNTDVPSNMGPFGTPGASLRGWREIFPQAIVCGADIDHSILFQEDRIKTFHCDQLDRSNIRELWANPDLHSGVDIIIEDGLHSIEANVAFLEGSLGHLRPGGIYVTEDIVWSDIDEWYQGLETIYSKQYATNEFAFVTLANGGNLLVVRRAAD